MNVQMLQGPEAAQLALLQKKMALEGRARNGINWFFWIAALSLVNTGAYLLGTTWSFVIGLGITQVVDGIMAGLVHEFGPGWGALRIAGLVVDLLIAGAFVLIGYFGRKGLSWAVIVGMVLYALDAVLLLLFGDFFAAIFHGWALFSIWTGLQAQRSLKALQQAPAGAVPSGLGQQPPAIGQL